MSRAPSLRTNSNGSVVLSSHRRSSSNSAQSLQLEPLAKGSSSVRYQVNNKVRYINSAPTTPKGSSSLNTSPHLRQPFDASYGVSNQGSPIARRHQSNSMQNHRRVSHNVVISSEPSLRDPRYHNDFKHTNYSDPRLDNRNLDSLPLQPYDSRNRSGTEPRRYNTIQQPHLTRQQELSKENLEQFNQYSSGKGNIHFTQPVDRRELYKNESRSAKYLQDHRLSDQRNVSFQGESLSDTRLHEINRLENRLDHRSDHRIDSRLDPRTDPRIDPRIDARQDLRIDNRIDNRNLYGKHNFDTNFKSIDNSYNSRDIHQYHNENDIHRLPLDLNRNPSVPSSSSQQKGFYRNEYVDDKSQLRNYHIHGNILPSNDSMKKDHLSPKRNTMQGKSY